MPDLSSISAALSSIKAATDIAKLIKESDISLEKAEIKLKLADLVSELADARMEIANIQEILIQKDGIINNLKKQQEIRDVIKYKAPYYYLTNETGQEGPYCQCCYDNNSKLIRLTEEKCLKGTFHCKVCGSWYGEGHYDLR